MFYKTAKLPYRQSGDQTEYNKERYRVVADRSDQNCNEDYTGSARIIRFFKAVLFSSFVDLFFVQR